jgi:hypothetical protein
MITKHLLRPQRLRQIPASFSWVDHRLVRNDYLARADHGAWALYLFLADLLAYQKPLYQVLALPEDSKGSTALTSAPSGQAQSVAQILRRALEGGKV